jgi:hypothetical protein
VPCQCKWPTTVDPLQPLAKDASGQAFSRALDQLLDTLTADLYHSLPALFMYRCEISSYALSRASENSFQKSIVARP